VLSALQPNVSSVPSSLPASELAIPFVEGHQVTNYFIVGAVAILVYDYLLTASDEIIFIWQRRLGPFSCFFYLIRYLPFIDSGFFLALGFAQKPSPETCRVYFTIETWLYFAGVFTSIGALILRTYAIWDSSKRISSALTLLLVFVAAPAAYFISETVASKEYFPTPKGLTSAVLGCSPYAQGKDTIWVSYLFMIIVETVIFILTLWKLSRQKRNTHLIRTIYRDGICFYIFLLAASIVNVVFFNLGPADLASILIPPHRILHAILSGRLLLNIRSTLIDGRVWYQIDLTEDTETES